MALADVTEIARECAGAGRATVQQFFLVFFQSVSHWSGDVSTCITGAIPERGRWGKGSLYVDIRRFTARLLRDHLMGEGGKERIGLL